jgi:hypothetical protein
MYPGSGHPFLLVRARFAVGARCGVRLNEDAFTLQLRDGDGACIRSEAPAGRLENTSREA